MMIALLLSCIMSRGKFGGVSVCRVDVLLCLIDGKIAMAVEQGEGGVDMVLPGEAITSSRGAIWGRRWTISPHYPIMRASYAHY